MLPNFRFLSTAILVSISFLVFGLGLSALLRNTHDRFTARSLGERDSGYVQKLEPLPMTATTLHVEPLAPTSGAPALEDDRVIADDEDDEFDRLAEDSTGTAPRADAASATGPAPHPLSPTPDAATELSPVAPDADRKSTELSTELPTDRPTVNPVATTAIDHAIGAPQGPLPGPAQAPGDSGKDPPELITGQISTERSTLPEKGGDRLTTSPSGESGLDEKDSSDQDLAEPEEAPLANPPEQGQAVNSTDNSTAPNSAGSVVSQHGSGARQDNASPADPALQPPATENGSTDHSLSEDSRASAVPTQDASRIGTAVNSTDNSTADAAPDSAHGSSQPAELSTPQSDHKTLSDPAGAQADSDALNASHDSPSQEHESSTRSGDADHGATPDADTPSARTDSDALTLRTAPPQGDNAPAVEPDSAAQPHRDSEMSPAATDAVSELENALRSSGAATPPAPADSDARSAATAPQGSTATAMAPDSAPQQHSNSEMSPAATDAVSELENALRSSGAATPSAPAPADSDAVSAATAAQSGSSDAMEPDSAPPRHGDSGISPAAGNAASQIENAPLSTGAATEPAPADADNSELTTGSASLPGATVTAITRTPSTAAPNGDSNETGMPPAAADTGSAQQSAHLSSQASGEAAPTAAEITPTEATPGSAEATLVPPRPKKPAYQRSKKRTIARHEEAAGSEGGVLDLFGSTPSSNRRPISRSNETQSSRRPSRDSRPVDESPF
ncbi:MAG: hypothetical protein FWD68_08000 [Alphaproteobacteria bacterium]|nr:hypothetical protein [Alphaproteobacteria bacterium]